MKAKSEFGEENGGKGGSKVKLRVKLLCSLSIIALALHRSGATVGPIGAAHCQSSFSPARSATITKTPRSTVPKGLHRYPPEESCLGQLRVGSTWSLILFNHTVLIGLYPTAALLAAAFLRSRHGQI